MNSPETIYENFKLCPELKSNQLCLVLEQYDAGIFRRLFHKHIPSHRLSKEKQLEVLKAFVVRYTPLWDEAIVSAYVNSRGRDPAQVDHFQIHVSRPEPGVLRTYCGTNTHAWIDTVIAPWGFRRDPQSRIMGIG